MLGHSLESGVTVCLARPLVLARYPLADHSDWAKLSGSLHQGLNICSFPAVGMASWGQPILHFPLYKPLHRNRKCPVLCSAGAQSILLFPPACGSASVLLDLLASQLGLPSYSAVCLILWPPDLACPYTLHPVWSPGFLPWAALWLHTLSDPPASWLSLFPNPVLGLAFWPPTIHWDSFPFYDALFRCSCHFA